MKFEPIDIVGHFEVENEECAYGFQIADLSVVEALIARICEARNLPPQWALDCLYDELCEKLSEAIDDAIYSAAHSTPPDLTEAETPPGNPISVHAILNALRRAPL